MAGDRAASRAPRTGAARASFGFAAVGGAWAAAHGLDLLGPLESLTFLLLGVATITATVVGVRRYRPRLRWPWGLMCAALILFVIGGAARLELHTLGNVSASRTLIPDAITLPGYLLLAIGLSGLARVRGRGLADELDNLLDGAVAALAALTLAWVYLIDPVLFHQHSPLPVRLVLAAYPAMSVLFVAIAAPIALIPGKRRAAAYRFLLAATAFLLAGDVIYMFAEVGVVRLPPSLLDLPYALAFVAFGAHVLHPSMRALCEPVAPSEVAQRRGRVGFIAVALSLPALVTVVRGDSVSHDRIPLAVIVLALTATAVWRLLRALAAHARSEALLSYQATHDVLTGLPNRRLALEELGRALVHAGEVDSHVALVFIDVDRFKLVNDTVGHSIGDRLLIAVGTRLVDRAPPAGLVARIGGDEFVVVLDRMHDLSHAVELADGIRRSFAQPFSVGESELYTSASLGVAYCDGLNLDMDAETMIRDADTAMYQAKDAGRDGVAVFDTSMHDLVTERLALERDLRQGMERGELHLHFQPVVQLCDGRIEGFEALLRWAHPVRGSIPPVKFIPIAEDTGLIVEIGSWVVREACRYVAQWRQEIPGAEHLYVAVNVSGRQLRDDSFADTVSAALFQNGLLGEALAVELTESVLMDDPSTTAGTLAALRLMNIRVLVDDFGTGYSSLAYLKRFPVDCVKIDQSFVAGLDDDDTSDQTLVAAIIAMARALGLGTIAEGVETAGQELRLRQLGCEVVQGYLYSRPVAPEVVPDLLQLRLDAGGRSLRRTA